MRKDCSRQTKGKQKGIKHNVSRLTSVSSHSFNLQNLSRIRHLSFQVRRRPTRQNVLHSLPYIKTQPPSFSPPAPNRYQLGSAGIIFHINPSVRASTSYLTHFDTQDAQVVTFIEKMRRHWGLLKTLTKRLAIEALEIGFYGWAFVTPAKVVLSLCPTLHILLFTPTDDDPVMPKGQRGNLKGLRIALSLTMKVSPLKRKFDLSRTQHKIQPTGFKRT